MVLIKSYYKVIGVMSGTSLDGIDLAYCYFSILGIDQWDFKFLTTETIEYPVHWKMKLKNAIHYSDQQIQDLDASYTEYLAEIISNFIQKHNISELDAICSHGHTIKHQPDKGFTIQIGNTKKLATITGFNVVCNFRVQDVQLGGQGAPLVPLGDRLLFSEFDYCLNLGGFANISLEKNKKRIAYDVCPVNIVLNHYSGLLGFDFDDKGTIAASGSIDDDLIKRLNTLDYYKQRPPKSLGLEWVISNIFPLIQSKNIETKDILHTFIEHIAMQLSDQFSENKTVIATGGGAYNSYLLERLEYYSKIDLIIPLKELIDYKEALIFGLLGVLRIRNENNCLASVTGAKKDHSSGTIFYPK